MASVAVSILFDAAYIEPALVTAFEVVTHLRPCPRLYLVYLADGKSDAVAGELIQGFCQRVGSTAEVIPLALKNTLPQFSVHHFNNSIIYKSLMPSAVPGERFLLNIDAGILIGERFAALWAEMNQKSQEDADWVVCAHCHEPEEYFPDALKGERHHALYPAGNMLLFNCRQYVAAQWPERLLENYYKYHAHLRYAEQELMCLTAEEAELVELPGTELRVTPFLGLDVLYGQKPGLSITDVEKSLFFKFVGSFKPWKYWVLDPDKHVYLKRRALLEAVLPLSGNPLIESMRISAANPNWPPAFQRAYDTFLVNA